MPLLAVPAIALCSLFAWADGPQDNLTAKPRPIPKPGIAVPDDVRQELEKGLADLKAKLSAIEAIQNPKLRGSLPDVAIFHKAVRYALHGDEFFDQREFAKARALIAEGIERADAVLERKTTPWREQTGLAVLGYVSKIDGSLQPYGLVVPDSFTPKAPHRHRLDVWFHGRGETLSEVNFLDDRRKNKGEFAPEDAFVLHPYGRFCNSAKFAGEIDALEALEDVKARYKIDDDRIAVRGFSMGGASAWHFAVHYPDLWFAANPGAGFSETPRFLRVFQNEKVQPTWYERTLWRLYDCDGWAGNLLNCPTVAYSGEIDKQKQAADVMAEALAKRGLALTHMIGPKTAHKYEPGAKAVVARKLDELAKQGRTALPLKLDFTTFTLRYDRDFWLTIDAIDEHWAPARAQAKATLDQTAAIELALEGVSALRINFPAGSVPPQARNKGVVRILPESPGGPSAEPEVPGPETDGSWSFALHREDGHWRVGPAPAPTSGLKKTHGLQGPIDDAFMDAFIFVRPTGPSRNAKTAQWVKSELDRAGRRWRTQMRGDARVKNDTEINEADIASSNLVLWGDPQSNAVLAKIAEKLPIRWRDGEITAGTRKYDSSHHIPILIFPNPLNPSRYVVLNSGFTYREYDDLSNARQVPRLPDWAIVDVDVPADSRFPGKIAAADFFDESWNLKPPHNDD